MDGFLRAASEWRDANPATELREPDPLLTPPTREGLQAAADRAAGVEKADAAEQKRLADKAAADAQRDEFTLTGSNSAADLAAAAGQGSLFEPRASYRTRITETLKFRRWFGNSKVVDAQGKPQVVYHGTRYVLGPDYRITDQGFEVFKTGGKGRDTSYGPGAYFATNPRQADSFAGAYRREGGGYHPASEHQGGHVYPVYLSLQNPIGSTELVRKFEAQLNGRVVADDDIGPEIGAFARGLGHDGIYIDEQKAWIAFKPEQIKSATGNSGAFNPADPSIVREDRAAYNTDLFGNPVESPAPRRGALRPVRRETPTDTEALPGDYQERTIVGTETRRKLGAATIKTPADLAAATRHLYKSAVERLDGIVTDAQGKPLAVIGGFKGALSQVAVYPATLVAEAVRVPGAAKLWLSHNHPSGTAELSGADESMEQNIRRVFDGTGIEVEGIAAIAGDRYAFAGGSKYSRDSGNIPAPGAAADVPVIERELVPAAEGKGHSINEPRKAKAAALRYYQAAGSRPGMLLMDAQLKPVAYVPIPTALEGKLKGTGGLRAVYRAISEANAGAAILVHGGELDRSNPRMNVPSIGTNIARALRQIDVNVLDDINVTTGRSRADDGTLAPGGAVWSVAALTAGAGALAMAGQDDDDGES